jgi:hypothetical protein
MMLICGRKNGNEREKDQMKALVCEREGPSTCGEREKISKKNSCMLK